MKHNHNHDNTPSAIHPLPVRFEFKHPTAASVCVAGSFNDWKPEAKTLHSSGSGLWWKETVLNPGTYEYCFVVDGQWIPDPQASESVANPFGGRNSVLKVEETSAASTSSTAPTVPANSAASANPNTKANAAAAPKSKKSN